MDNKEEEQKFMDDWREWLTIPCTSQTCRGLRYGKGFPVVITRRQYEEFKQGKFRPICNECFGK